MELTNISINQDLHICLIAIRAPDYGGTERKTVLLGATEWKGAEENMIEGSRTGQILTVRAPAPHAGWL